MIKREKNTIGIVKDVICKVAPKKQLQTVLALCMNLKNQSALRKDWNIKNIISFGERKRSTYVTIFNQTKSQHFIHRYGFAMDFYSSISGILVVHISDYSGKLCLSARLCFLFMRKQRWYRTYLSRSLLMADSIVLSGNFLQWLFDGSGTGLW